jgi:outer membrane protein assembly factor BamA
LNPSNVATNPSQTTATPHNEFNIVPFIGGSSDIGFGGGYVAGLARVAEGYTPYVWNLESLGFITFWWDDGLEIPFQDLYLKLTVPRFFGPVRLEVRPSYTWETTLKYYGLGNASQVPPKGTPDEFSEYGRLHPQISFDTRWKIADHLAGRTGVRFVYNWLQVEEDSQLADDMAFGTPEVKKLLGNTEPHAVVVFKYGLQWDSRDNEASTHSGTFDTVDVRLSPGTTEQFPYRYGQVTAIGRLFLPLWKPHVTIATRVVGDLMFGDPPFYELARYEDTYALGGVNGVRGIPAQRYYGKVKVFGNAELRTEVVSFRALGKSLILGVTGFFDAGRVWADTTPQPELDGTGIGLKYGVGGGLRLQSGTAFVLRADVAWSPDATPIGAYLAAGQAF